MIKQLLGLALLCAPASAFAQTVAARQPVTVEIVASGEVVVPAQRFRMSVKLTAKGADDAAAGAALAANRARLIQALGAQGIREAKPYEGESTSIASLFASIGNRGKPSFSQDLVLGDETATDGEKPQTTATETVMFDAPSRAAVTNAHAAAEANGGTVEEEMIAILDDYVTPNRQAKANALKKAQAEADAYAAALGLRGATLVKISERQDVVAGSLGFLSQIVGMFAPKGQAAANTVSVQANLTAEFQLSR
jgi:uncharacterized protein YggE